MASADSIAKNNEFIERYRICSSTGRMWTRKMLIDGVMRKTSMPRSEVSAVVDNDEFMRGCAGLIPVRVIEDIIIAVFTNRAGV